MNVGAGTGSCEPDDCLVVAIETGAVMVAQRGPSQLPAIRASSAALPLRDDSVDAAMSVLSLHHWDDAREVAADFASGACDARFGGLRALSERDLGVRIIISQRTEHAPREHAR